MATLEKIGDPQRSLDPTPSFAQEAQESHATKTPYQYPNHKNRYLNQSMSQQHSGRKQLTYLPKNIDTSVIASYNNKYWVLYKCNVPQRIELGWSNPFTVRRFCSAIRSSYRLVSSTMRASKTKNHVKILQAREKDIKPLHKYALRTKQF